MAGPKPRAAGAATSAAPPAVVRLRGIEHLVGMQVQVPDAPYVGDRGSKGYSLSPHVRVNDIGKHAERILSLLGG